MIVGLCIGPLAQTSLDEPFGLAIGFQMPKAVAEAAGVSSKEAMAVAQRNGAKVHPRVAAIKAKAKAK